MYRLSFNSSYSSILCFFSLSTFGKNYNIYQTKLRLLLLQMQMFRIPLTERILIKIHVHSLTLKGPIPSILVVHFTS